MTVHEAVCSSAQVAKVDSATTWAKPRQRGPKQQISAEDKDERKLRSGIEINEHARADTFPNRIGHITVVISGTDLGWRSGRKDKQAQNNTTPLVVSTTDSGAHSFAGTLRAPSMYCPYGTSRRGSPHRPRDMASICLRGGRYLGDRS